jgi:hypothetical protein
MGRLPDFLNRFNFLAIRVKPRLALIGGVDRGAIIEVVDIGATGHFPPLVSPPRGPLQRTIGKEPGSCR